MRDQPQYPTHPPLAPDGWAPPEWTPSGQPGGPDWSRPPVPAPASSRRSGSRRTGMVIVALAVVAALVSGLLVWLIVDDPTESASEAAPEQVRTDPTEPPVTETPATEPPVTEPPATEPPATEPPVTEPTTDLVPMTPTGDAQLDAAIDDAARFVERERGLLFREPVEVEVLDDDEFVTRLETTFEEEDAEDLEITAGLFRALGFIDDDVDLVESLESLLSIGVLGFYDQETGELVVRGSEPTLYTQQTIVHELVHALDDQWFELYRPELDESDDESSFGFSALVEGNARRIEDIWEEELSPSDRQDLLEEEMRFGLEVDPSVVLSIPDVLIELLMAPYEIGDPFVQELLANGGQARLDEAFEEPPVTSEQVLHPERFLAAEPVVAVDPPPADGEVVDEGAFGELVLQLLLDDAIGGSDAEQAADGWGGDWYVAWEDGDDTCVRTDVATDTETDRSELAQALEAWADDADVSAEVEELDEVVRFTSCG